MAVSFFRSAVCLVLLLPGHLPAADYRHLSISELQTRADRDDPAAMVELGELLEHGEGVARNPRTAVELYCRAAARGSKEAQRNLGWMYFSGQGVHRDDARAGYWLRKAAASGDDFAKRQLGRVAGLKPPRENGCERLIARRGLRNRCRHQDCGNIFRLVESLSRPYGLDTRLVLSVISAESAFDSRARSTAGARGLMQLMPETARRFGVEDPWDPEQNIRGGMAYLRWLLAFFEGDVKRVLAAYNAGEHKVLQYDGIPPFPETRAYVKRVILDYGKDRHPYDTRWLKKTLSAGGSVSAVVEPSVPGVDG